MKLESIEQKASYAIGLQIGQQLKESGLKNLDLDALKLAMQDVLAGNQPALPLQELHDALRHIHEQAAKEKAQQAEKNAQAGKDFLADNLKKAGVKSTESGLQYEIITEGSGAIPKATDRVQVHYTGQLIDGTVFDSSVQRGQPAEFPVNGVIQGWVEALQLMPEGSKWRLYIPQELAYGAQGAGASIAPYSTLIFDVELLKVL
ncbi:FKBP-type peptidyl-prolyl cis-trans isomerase [Gilliamella sp. B2923]|uniref:FKBP-type peptidyl-prolyl cis-trans isomerase n=1 Tax=Gilliamella sp. B2923 TaxID=2818005 RepID=UPI002269B227|nr:FKBP-type peptidyl-prolyl cis-trans isomerase [Gilliamella sp. B2923]MCX8617679.1 FKBP-type peptidyl-prolyl cis-trans isomerase [Gilliamella sp. B2923]